MKIQIVRFENGQYGARIKRLLDQDEYIDKSGETFRCNKNIHRFCMFNSLDEANKVAHEYAKIENFNKKKLKVEVIEELYF